MVNPAYLAIPILILNIENDSDREFMIELFSTYQHLMYNTAVRIVNDHQIAEDMVQEACIAIINHLSIVRKIDDCKLRSYIVSIVRNTSINYVVKRDRRSKYSFLVQDETVLVNVEDSNDIDAEIIREAEIRDIKLAIQQLSERDRHILQMKYYDELKDSDIASVLNVKPSSIRFYLTQARRHLAALLDGERKL